MENAGFQVESLALKAVLTWRHPRASLPIIPYMSRIMLSWPKNEYASCMERQADSLRSSCLIVCLIILLQTFACYQPRSLSTKRLFEVNESACPSPSTYNTEAPSLHTETTLGEEAFRLMF